MKIREENKIEDHKRKKKHVTKSKASKELISRHGEKDKRSKSLTKVIPNCHTPKFAH